MSQLILSVIKAPSEIELVQMLKVFDEAGGVIGRASSSDWYLPDTGSGVDKKHAYIRKVNGQYFLEDHSSSGVFINESKERATTDAQTPICDGDLIRIGGYQIRARVGDAEKLVSAAAQDGALPYTIKSYSIRPLTEALIIGVTAFFVVLITTYFIYFHALNAQKGEIREGIARTAQILTQFVDAESHKSFLDRDQENTDAYKEALMPFEKAMTADPSIAFIYTGILKNDKVFFILDPTPEGDADGDGVDDKAHIMDEYSEAADEMKEALRKQETVVSTEPYTDRWGSFFSAYAPIFDSQGGFVGVLGVDIAADNYFERLAPIKRATARAAVAGFFVAFMVGALVWFMRNFSRVVNDSRIEMYKDLNQRAEPESDRSGSATGKPDVKGFDSEVVTGN
jgi:hypothetical protein